MHYKIQHTTCYTYSAPVLLSTHALRLRPRCEVAQQLRSFALSIDPQPANFWETVDLEGNSIAHISFREAIESLTVTAISEVTTTRTNPFDFLLEPWAIQIPIDYPSSLASQLQPYLTGYLGAIDPAATALAQEIFQTVSGNSIAFLSELNQRIYSTCRYRLREVGEPFPAGITWRQDGGGGGDRSINGAIELFCQCEDGKPSVCGRDGCHDVA